MSDVSPPITLSLIVAVTENGVIGREGAMPWHLGTDLKRFRTLTMGKPVIMGRKTYASIGRPLPGRSNIVISRNHDFFAPNAYSQGFFPCSSFNTACYFAWNQAMDDGVSEFFVIGGSEIFNLALPLAQKIYLTEILATIEGDTFFPPFERSLWQTVSIQEIPAGEQDSHPTRFRVYERIVSPGA